jgi:tetratricopeptide (TPR) repeat protein
LLLAEGHALLKKGNKNGIWDGIEKYSKASTLYPQNGEPLYWIAIAYTKLGDKDFDLILESYEKALSLELDSELRVKAGKKYKHAKERKKKLDSFWR